MQKLETDSNITRLHTLGNLLCSATKYTDKIEREKVEMDVLQQIWNILNCHGGKDGIKDRPNFDTCDEVTTYELICSGVLEVLLSYITHMDETSCLCTPQMRKDELHRRQRLFCYVFFALPLSNKRLALFTPLHKWQAKSAVFVRKLVGALNAVENFEPYLVSIPGANKATNSVKQLSQKLRIRLCYKHSGTTNSRDPSVADTLPHSGKFGEMQNQFHAFH